MFWFFLVLALLNLGWVFFVEWVVKKLPKSDRVTFYGIFLSGPVGWAIFVVMLVFKLAKSLYETDFKAIARERETDELEDVLREAQKNGTLSRTKTPDFEDPDFDWESYEAFKNLE